jgi:iron complex outermembrane receptor protein
MKTSYLALAAALLPATAFAQDQVAADVAAPPQQSAQAPAADGGGFQDIVVTATKSARGDSAQKVPLAVTALSGVALREQSLNTVKDVGHVSPGVHLNEASFAGFANFMIRAKGLDGTVLTIEPTVGVVVDGMVHELLLGNIFDTYDIEAVEVLRGPQGILQGRNATGGVVSFRTRRPTDEFQAEAHALASSVGRYDFSGLVAGPIAPGLLKAKLSVFHSDTNGFYKDRNHGTFVPAVFNPSGTDTSSTGNQVKANIWSIRPTVVITPTTDLTVTLLGEYTHQTGTGGSGGRVASRALGYNVPVSPNFLTLLGYTPPTGKFDINLNEQGNVDLKATRLVGDISWDVGPGVFTSISGYRKVEYAGAFDGDATPFPLFEFPDGNQTNSKQYSQELRFASDFSDVISFVVGGYYSKLSIDTVELRRLSNLTRGLGNNDPFLQRGRFEQDGSSRALFYNIQVKPFDGLTFSHGGRYTKDKKRIEIVPIQACGSVNYDNCPDVPFNRKASFDDFSPRFTAEYEIMPRVLVYASHTKGYRSGVFNGRATGETSIGPAQPETVKTIEVGVKSTFLNGRARINVAAYTEKYEDIQRTISVNGVQTLGNAGSARIKGFEVETSFRPLDGLELMGNVSYVQPRFKEFLGLDVNGGGYDPAVDPVLAKQLRFNRVSEWTGYAGIRYTHEIGDDSRVIVGGNYIYQSSQFFDTLNEFLQPAVNMFNANIRYETNNWSIALNGKNLTKEYFGDQGTRFTFGPNTAPVGTTPNNRSYVMYGGEPREFTIEVGFKF